MTHPDTNNLKPEARARLLLKFRLSRRPWADLRDVDAMGEIFDEKTPGFTYLDSNLHIYGPSPHETNPRGDRFWLDICNEGWEEPATDAGLAVQEARLFDFALTEGYFDDEITAADVGEENAVMLAEAYENFRVATHALVVAIDLVPGEDAACAEAYPFSESFDEVSHRVQAWVEAATRRLEVKS